MIDSSLRRSLETMFNPSSVAVVGASDDPGRIGGRVLKNLTSRFPGVIYPINPNREIVQGLHAFPNVTLLPEAPDFAIVAVAGPDVVGVIHECGESGVGTALILSAGFAETGDPQWIEAQDKIRQTAATTGLRVVGPNCLGMICLPKGLFGTFSTIEFSNTPPSPFAIISQSGGLGITFWNEFYKLGLAASYLCTTGNEVDVTVAQTLTYLVEMPDVSTIALFLEGLNDPEELLTAGKRAQKLGKPIIAMKTGTSEPGARASVYHTGSSRTPDHEVNELFEEAGIIRVYSPNELIFMSSVFIGGRLPSGNRIGVMTVSGGVGVIIADEATSLGLTLPPPSSEGERRIRERIPPFGSWRNPVDYTGNVVNDPTSFDVVLDAVVSDDQFDVVCIAGTSPATALLMIEAIKEIHKRNSKPIVVYSTDMNHVRLLTMNGIPAFSDVVLMIRAVGQLRDYAENQRRA
jgi:acyl-CoA synthetase (NDP forming)